jgi:hypothetical protein
VISLDFNIIPAFFPERSGNWTVYEWPPADCCLSTVLTFGFCHTIQVLDAACTWEQHITSEADHGQKKQNKAAYEIVIN